MLQDLRQGLRVLLQNKGWTLVVVISLALGIGANTAIFSATNGFLLKTLAVDHPESLVRFRWVGDNDMGTDFSEYGYSEKDGALAVRSTFSYPMYQLFHKANQTLVDLIACAPQGQMNVVANGQAELASSLIASGNYFQMLGVRAVVGRTFTADDDQANAEPVVVISYGYWQRRFGGDANIVGSFSDEQCSSDDRRCHAAGLQWHSASSDRST